MIGTGTVTGLAGNVDLGPDGLEGIGRRIVVLAQVGGVAIRAHEVPVLLELRPVELVLVRDALGWIEVKPALSPCSFGRVSHAIDSAWSRHRKLHKVLLQWRDAKCVLDLEVRELAIGSIGADHELPVASEEGRCHTGPCKFHVGEVAEDGLLGRLLHRVRVL